MQIKVIILCSFNKNIAIQTLTGFHTARNIKYQFYFKIYNLIHFLFFSSLYQYIIHFKILFSDDT